MKFLKFKNYFKSKINLIKSVYYNQTFKNCLRCKFNNVFLVIGKCQDRLKKKFYDLIVTKAHICKIKDNIEILKFSISLNLLKITLTCLIIVKRFLSIRNELNVKVVYQFPMDPNEMERARLRWKWQIFTSKFKTVFWLCVIILELIYRYFLEDPTL